MKTPVKRNKPKKPTSGPGWVSHEESVVKMLKKDPKFAAEYLRLAWEESETQQELLIALRHVAQARGMAAVAKKAGMGRESLYRALSANGNPTVATLLAVTKALGFKLTLEAA
jgi:probable addiction module antidote protein